MLHLEKAYLNFLSGFIKIYFSGSDLIQKEISYFTNSQLQDGLIFFLICFDKLDKNFLNKIPIKNLNELKQYVDLDDNMKINKLHQKGEELKAYLEKKISIQASLLEFNGIQAEKLASFTTIANRFYKFWQNIIKISV